MIKGMLRRANESDISFAKNSPCVKSQKTVSYTYSELK